MCSSTDLGVSIFVVPHCRGQVGEVPQSREDLEDARAGLSEADGHLIVNCAAPLSAHVDLILNPGSGGSRGFLRSGPRDASPLTTRQEVDMLLWIAAELPPSAKVSEMQLRMHDRCNYLCGLPAGRFG